MPSIVYKSDNKKLNTTDHSFMLSIAVTVENHYH